MGAVFLVHAWWWRRRSAELLEGAGVISIAYNMDCMKGMKQYPDKYFDLAVVDPPYGIGVMSMNYTKSGAVRTHGHSAAKRRDYRKHGEWDTRPSKAYFDELFRVSSKQIRWGGQLLC